MVYAKIKRQGENILLSSLVFEVDDIFYKLRKADRTIRYELKLLNRHKFGAIEKAALVPLNDKRLGKMIHKINPRDLLMDEYVIYILENSNNSIFHLIQKYNHYINTRNNECKANNFNELADIDEKLIYTIRRLGAMICHLNTHLSLLAVLVKKASVFSEIQQAAFKQYETIERSGSLFTGQNEEEREFEFSGITIDGCYAIVTWTMGALKGDAILLQNEGHWQLVNISTDAFEYPCLDNVDISL
jgi:hypothetical protein